MKIQIEEFEDKDEPDENGNLSYYYSGKIFRFSKDKLTVTVRSYNDESPEIASFLSINSTLFDWKSVSHPFLFEIEKYLRAEGFTKIQILYGPDGYTAFPVTNLLFKRWKNMLRRFGITF